MSAVRFAGLGDISCQLYMMPYYVGMACTGMFAADMEWRSLPLHRCVYIALFGILSQNLNYAGNMMAGSGLFAVIYASVTIWNAIFSRFFLQRVLTFWQWCAITVVFSGLVLTHLGARNDGDRVWAGSCMVAVGAMVHAFSHVLSELVSVRGHKVPAQINCCVQGITACAVTGLWQCTYTAAHFEKISGPVAIAGTSWRQILVLVGALAAGNFVHAGTFFYLLTAIGSVSAGVLKGVQALAVFALAHIMYCSKDASECINPTKGAALFMVISGVLGYALSTSAASATNAALRSAPGPRRDVTHQA